MTSTTEAKRRLDAATEALEQAEAEYRAAREAAKPKEPAADSWVRILAVFPGGVKEYTYLALRPKDTPDGTDSWYVTGQSGKWYWEDVLRLLNRAETVHVDKLRVLS